MAIEHNRGAKEQGFLVDAARSLGSTLGRLAAKTGLDVKKRKSSTRRSGRKPALARAQRARTMRGRARRPSRRTRA